MDRDQNKELLATVMKACVAYSDRRSSFAAQPKSKVASGTWHERREAPELLALAHDLFGALLEGSELCSIQTTVSDLGLAPSSSLIHAMWGDTLLYFVFFGGPLTPDALRRILDRLPSPRGLCFVITIEPPANDTTELLVAIRQSARGVFLVTPTDIDNLANGSWPLSRMLYYKMTCSLVLDHNDQQTVFERTRYTQLADTVLSAPPGAGLSTLDDVLQLQEVGPDQWLAHPVAPEVLNSVAVGRRTFLLGPSASGKTTLALMCARARAEAGDTVCYADVGVMSDSESVIVATKLLEQLRKGRHVFLILDDLHSNPRIGEALIRWVAVLQESGYASRCRMLAVAWPDFLSDKIQNRTCGDVHIISASQVMPVIVERAAPTMKPRQLQRALAVSGSDLLILRLVLEALRKQPQDLSRDNLAPLVWKQRAQLLRIADIGAKRAMLVATTIGRFECEISPEFLKTQAHIGDPEVQELCRVRLLRRVGERLHAGHRSLCELFSNWLVKELETDPQLAFGEQPGLESLVLRYIHSLRPHEIWPILDLIQTHAGFRASHELRESGRIMTGAWQSMDAIIDRIVDQQRSDPSWGRTPSSAMFAVQALLAVGKAEHAEKSIAFLRNCYLLTDGQVSLQRADLDTTNDFIGIRDCMIEEDGVTDAYIEAPVFENGADVDPDRFHETWLMGVILCAEALWAPSDRHRIEALADEAERRLTPPGFYYPARVPWCTARVLMGLALCGRTVVNSDAVRLASEWLLAPRESGGPFNNGLWDSGTGTWNTAVETTAMCIVALLLAKSDPSDSRIQKALSELLARRSEWTRPGREIDGAMALQAFAMLRTDWRLVLPELNRLAMWSRGEATWRRATASSKETLEQSCRVAEVGALLVDVLWRMLRSDLPQLLHAFAISATSSADEATVRGEGALAPTSPAATPLPSSLFDATAAFPERVRLRDFVVVGKYLRVNNIERHFLTDVCGRIELACRAKTTSRQNFLLWGKPGTGKTFLIKELSASLAADIRYEEINLAECNEDTYSAALNRLQQISDPLLVFLDEFASHPSQTWPFELLMPRLDLNRSGGKGGIVWVLAGSSGNGVEEFIAAQRRRPRGADVLDRVPAANVVSIPAPTDADRMLVVLSHTLAEAGKSGKAIGAVERLALYYIVATPSLSTPRQIGDFVHAACGRVRLGQKSLKYDHLFEAGELRNKEFWDEHPVAARELSGQYVEAEV